MGRLLLVCRLVFADLRRRPVQAAVFLLTVGLAATALAVGLSVPGATGARYAQTRAATAGPDVVAQTEDDSPDALAALENLAGAPEVTVHSGPYLFLYTSITARGREARAVVEGRASTPDTLDRPLVTSGTWLDGGAVVEQGFAEALGVRTGDRITVAGREFPVAGVAVTAAHKVFPGAAGTGPYGGPSDYSGLVWLTEPDTRALSAPQFAPAYTMRLRLTNPAAATEFSRADRRDDVHLWAWQDIATEDAKVFRDTRPVLVAGGWLLAVCAVAGAAVLAATRAESQVRRVGLLKAVGATPGAVAGVLLAEYLALGLAAAGLGVVAGRLVTPALAGPTAGLLDADIPVTAAAVLPVLVLAVLVALASAAGPSLRAARTATVPALSASPRPADHAAGLTALAGRLPVPLLLGLRLVVRRPRRAVLSAAGIAAVGIALGAALALRAQPQEVYDLGGTTLANLRAGQTDRTVVAVNVALVVLAVVNTLIITWSTALDARRSLAVARAFGATPGQVTAAVAVAQVPSALHTRRPVAPVLRPV
ncbi:FtsX-like permease family protein [Amycolatopsis thermoflava]|uniref:FtsX-like permease family protein n=1 Tax=Amycolatopsis thermoflava TaxID=84480 RepID=UPI003EB90A1E